MTRRKKSARPFRTICNLVRLADRNAPAVGLGFPANFGAEQVHLHNPHLEMSVSSVDMQRNAPAASLASVAGDTVAAAPMDATLMIMVGHGGSLEIFEILDHSTKDVSVAASPAAATSVVT